MNFNSFGRLSVFAVLVTFAFTIAAAGKGGFDEFGYNHQANIFVGTADGVDRVLDGMLYGDSIYANDHLVMKWSKAWADARYRGAPWTCGAWIDNEWNGMS